MAQYNNYHRIFISAFLLACSVHVMAETVLGAPQSTTFTATINDGSCTIDFDSQQSELFFTPRLATDFSLGNTVEIRPITANVGCDYAVTPQVMIEGNAPYGSNTQVFLDGVTNGVGFMVLPARSEAERMPPSLETFYTDGIGGRAAVNGVPMSLIPLNGDNDFDENQVLWVGLVGMTDSSNIIPGAFKATLTIVGIIP